MKTSKFLVSVVLSGMVFVSSVFATDGNKPGSVSSKANNDVREQIVKALSDVSATDQEVLIRFSVTEKKGFELLKVEGESGDLVNTVKSELSTEKIVAPAEMEGVYSLKIRFSDTYEEKEDATTTLRNQIAEALSGVVVTEPASVKVAFSVANNGLTLKNVEGNDKTLVSSVELALSKSTIVPPAELAGNYQVTVKF